MGLSDLDRLDQARSIGKPCPKDQPAVIGREEKRKTKAQQEKAFRQAVWERDGGRSRASGTPLGRSGTDPKKVGEVHHVLPRSVEPARKFAPDRGILLSRMEHLLAEAACPGDPAKCYLDIHGPEDLSKPQTFIWRDRDGKELRRRVG